MVATRMGWWPSVFTAALGAVAVGLLPVAAQAQTTAAAVPGLDWVPASGGRVPVNALPVGVDNGRTAYACRVRHDGVRIGKLVGALCRVPMSGAEIEFPYYEVLVGEPWMLSWSAASGPLPDNGLAVGEVNGRPAVLCRVEHMGGIHPGMVVDDRCHFGLNGKEIMAIDYRYAEPSPSGRFSLQYASGGWVPPGALTVTTGEAPPTAGPAICLAQSGERWVPGMVTDAATCRYVEAGTIRESVGYTVVVGDPRRVAWVAYEGGELPRWDGPPEDSVRIGGFDPQDEPAAVCRTDVGGRTLAGHVEEGNCLVPVGESRIAAVPRYEVLHYIRDSQIVREPGPARRAPQ